MSPRGYRAVQSYNKDTGTIYVKRSSSVFIVEFEQVLNHLGGPAVLKPA